MKFEEKKNLKTLSSNNGQIAIEDISEKDLINKNFSRYFNGSKYVLFKKLSTENGFVFSKIKK